MKSKFSLTNMLFQLMIFINSGFIILIQLHTIRQPAKLLIQIICILSLLSLLINLYNYLKEEKE